MLSESQLGKPDQPESRAGVATLEEGGTVGATTKSAGRRKAKKPDTSTIGAVDITEPTGESGEPTGIIQGPEQPEQPATNETARIKPGSRPSSKMRLKPNRKEAEELWRQLENVPWVTAETPAGTAPEIKNSENETTEDIPEGDIASGIDLNEDVSKMGPGEPLYIPLKEQKVYEPNIFDKMRISIRDSIRKFLKIPGKVPRSYSESDSKEEKTKIE